MNIFEGFAAAANAQVYFHIRIDFGKAIDDTDESQHEWWDQIHEWLINNGEKKP